MSDVSGDTRFEDPGHAAIAATGGAPTSGRSGVTPIKGPAGFAGGWWLDWAEDPDPVLGTALARAGAVSDMRPLRRHPLASDRRLDGAVYALSATTVAVNPEGPAVRLRYCSHIDFDCDLCDGDGLLVAATESEGQPSPDTAPIRLVFSAPLAAVGTRVSGAGQDATGGVFDALLWVRLDGEKEWQPAITAKGRLGSVVASGTATAPFLGARAAAGGPGIREARLAISTGRNRRFGAIAVCPLHGLP